MTSPAGAIAITLKPAINSATFETRRLVILHDRPIWLGRADPSLNRSPTTDNGWFSSPVLDEKNAMIYMCWNEVRHFQLIRSTRVISQCANDITACRFGWPTCTRKILPGLILSSSLSQKLSQWAILLCVLRHALRPSSSLSTDFLLTFSALAFPWTGMLSRLWSRSLSMRR
jgi:hypothetical protein